jgi:predicted O-methyltransferase YrrM
VIGLTALRRRARGVARHVLGPPVAIATDAVRAAKTTPASRRQAALVSDVVALTAGWRCRATVARVERDKARTVRRLGDRPQDLRPLAVKPKLYTTEAQAVVGVATPPAGGALLWAVTRALRPGKVVEIGSGHGYGALYIGSALRADGAGRLTSFEGVAIRVQMARTAVARFGLTRHVDVVEGPFEQTLPGTLPHLRPVDLVFADGGKEPDATRAEFDALLDAMPRGGHMVYDDIDFSPEIIQVWAAIVGHERVLAATEFSGRWGLIEVAAA